MQNAVHQEHVSLLESHWWFRARRDIFARFIAANVQLPERATVLDVGPGSGANLPLLGPLGAVDVLDIDDGSLRECRTRGARAVVRGDAQKPPFVAGGYDLICLLDVLEHLDDDVACLRAMRSLLRKQSSRVLVSVPALPLLWGRQDVLSEHRRRYRRRQLNERLEAAGLVVERSTYFNSLLLPPILAVRLAMRPFLGRVEKQLESAKSDLSMPAFGLTELLFQTFAIEGRWLARRDLPIGVSLLALARAA